MPADPYETAAEPLHARAVEVVGASVVQCPHCGEMVLINADGPTFCRQCFKWTSTVAIYDDEPDLED